MIFRFVDFDYNVHPGEKGKAWAAGSSKSMMYVPTFMTYSGYILGNHSTELDLAWARNYDNYYTNERTEYKVVTDGYTVQEPAAAAIGRQGTETELDPGSGADNMLKGDQRIVLDVKQLKGEAVYYTLIDQDEDKTIAKDEVYRGGIDVEAADQKKNYKLIAYARSRSVNSDTIEYDFTIRTDRHEVKVIYNGETTHPHTFRCGENLSFPVMAKDVPDNTFVSWSVENGNGDDVTDLFFSETGPKTSDQIAVFTMPEEGSDERLGEGYSLVFHAEYDGKIATINAVDSGAVPQAGEELAPVIPLRFGDSEETVDYPVTWTYWKNGKTILASGEAYRNTAYTAAIRITQDPNNGIMFASTTDIATASGAHFSFGRNNADGSILLFIYYEATGAEAGSEAADGSIKLTINEMDMNTEAQDPGTDPQEFYVNAGDEVTLSAPQVKDEIFMMWEMGDSGIQITGDHNSVIMVKIPDDTQASELTIDAWYMPVIKKVDAEVAAPVSGKPLAKTAGAYVTITSEYEIDPEFITVSWSPKGGGKNETAQNKVAYAVTVTVKPKTDEGGDPYIRVREKGAGGDYVKKGAYFAYADDLEVTLNGETAGADTAHNRIIYSFPATLYNLTGIRTPENITLPHSSAGDVEGDLPKAAKIVVSGGIEMDAGIEWTKLPDFEDTLEEQTGTAEGKLVLPETVGNADELDLNFAVQITLEGADPAESPVASIGSGDYLSEQIVTLSTKTEGGTIHYTVDGSQATEDSPVYDGQPIPVTKEGADEEGNFTLRAMTVREGMRNSEESVYIYTFTNKVPVPEMRELTHNGRDQIGVQASSYYTLEPVTAGVTIDEDGNAVAADVGSYEVRAKLTDPENFQWKVTKEDGTVDGTTEDQIVTFKISYRMGRDGTALGPGASAEAADAAITGMKSDKDPAGSQIAPLLLKSAKQGKHNVKLTWKKPAGAVRYVVYGNARGAKNKMTKLAEVTGGSYNAKKIKKSLKAKTYHKFIVVALDRDGYVVSTSKVIFASTKGSKKLDNPKAAIVKAKVNAKGKKIKKYKTLKKTVLKKGKSLKLKTGIKKGKKTSVKKCAAMRYASSNSSVATVSAKGVIKAKKKGKCKIYVYAQNGAYKTVTITVK